jgi:hypothetical protein
MGHDAPGLRNIQCITFHAGSVLSEKYVTLEVRGGLGSPYVVKAKAMKALFGSVS